MLELPAPNTFLKLFNFDEPAKSHRNVSLLTKREICFI